MFDFSVVYENLGLYADGLWVTLKLVLTSLVLGLFLAIPTALARNSHSVFLKWPSWAFIYFFRGTPLLIQLFMIYYGASQWDWLWQSSLREWFEQAWFCALLAFTLNTAAYTAEIIRGAMNALPKGELEAARAYGMSYWLSMRRIILPSAFRRALPAYSNEVIFMLHSSALAGVITIVDLFGAARIINARYYAPFEAYLSVGLIYLCVTFVLVGLFKLLEKRWYRHLRPLTELQAQT